MNRRTLLIVLAILVIVGLGYYFYSNPIAPAFSYTVIETGDRQHRENEEFYTVQINYPDKTPLAERGSGGAENRAMATITRTAADLVGQFKEVGNVNNLSQEEKDRLTQANQKYSLNVGYKPYSSGNYVSYEFDIFMDTGGAHPNNLFKTLVFDLNGNTVELGDLFTNSSYLERISQMAQTQVRDQLIARAGEASVESLINEGIAPRAENFANFVVDSDRLRIFIPPYQAAPYAAGSFEVQVPLVDVKDILKPEVK
ncbi:MAG TPA: DUF3298 domain-containing protein [Candidatus Paceibacterota bacterium]|nr:DUF3298 domain-containing protein [Candidatus Paceibacterota bacterium]